MKSDSPESYIPDLLAYTRTHLTCRAMAQYIFDSVGCPNPKRVLFLNSQTNPDYLRCLTLIGMKQILGSRCVESVFIPHIYEDYDNPTKLYGRGFTYSRALPVSAKPPPVHIAEVLNRSFDLVVYGNIHRGMPYWEEIRYAYPPNQIVLLCGEDCDASNPTIHACVGQLYAQKGFHVFIRELA